jgi:hypothetical protein
MSPSPNSPWARLRRLGLGLLLLAVPACGLSDYEARMLDAQEREKHFQEEEKYLDKPVEMPTKPVKMANEKKARDVAVANVFFRPPTGIVAKPSPGQRLELMWTYPSSQGDSDFTNVELAFGENDKEFADKVLKCYQQAGQPKQLPPRHIARPGQEPPLAFDRWEFSSGPIGVSVNIVQGRVKPVAIVYFYKKTHRDLVDKVIELSLQTLAFDSSVLTARQRYDQKSPWQLRSTPGG